MRVGLAACIVVGSALIGKSLTGAAHRRASALKAVTQGVKNLRVHIVNMSEPLQNALDQSECPLLSRVGRQMRQGMSADESWNSLKPVMRRSGGPADALCASDTEVLDRMFERLGQSGRDAQDILLAGAVQSLERLCESAIAKAGEADRLYVTLGLLIGLMLALIVL